MTKEELIDRLKKLPRFSISQDILIDPYPESLIKADQLDRLIKEAEKP
jgi:hypothetical protein